MLVIYNLRSWMGGWGSAREKRCGRTLDSPGRSDTIITRPYPEGGLSFVPSGMIFKNELPPSRYALEDDIEDTELPYDCSFKLDMPTSIMNRSMVLISPRCAKIGAPLLGSVVGSATLVTTTKLRSESTISGIYEAEVDEEDFTKTTTVPFDLHDGPDNSIVLIFPVVNDSQAAYLGRSLVRSMEPTALILLTPGQSYTDSPLTFIASATNHWSISNHIRPAEPPVLIQGPGASALSRAQQCDIPTLALVLKGEGPVNFEILAPRSMELATSVLIELLGSKASNPKTVEKDISELYV